MRFQGLDRPTAIAVREQKLAEARSAKARKLVAASLAVQFNDDPLFPSGMSRLLSSASSVVKRHGRLIEADVAYTFERNHVLVERNRQLPFTEIALKAVAEGRSRFDGGQELPFDPEDEVGSVEIDILAVDEDNGWACAISSKRGGGNTETKKRKSHESELRALDLILLSQLRARFPGLQRASVRVLDYLGQSGFSDDVTLRRNQIDRFFGLPMVSVLDETTQRLRMAIKEEFGPLIERAMRALNPEQGAEEAAPTNLLGEVDATQSRLSDGAAFH